MFQVNWIERGRLHVVPCVSKAAAWQLAFALRISGIGRNVRLWHKGQTIAGGQA